MVDDGLDSVFPDVSTAHCIVMPTERFIPPATNNNDNNNNNIIKWIMTMPKALKKKNPR